ncbi:helix-turn-helix domain-containing protein [Candidatus Xianfuyuplasma coldseepsis]|uniref:PucR C-terminal helix-turn-helix domain-containing protein n=1 Tax=Candidatus Xianfuyuplasma coldseepsis TaxID=2782163 RepID=A0A7L7KNT0_9MOLU|nr:helix-turn-helix domain-containing protein [Xianfuyuplasma coldseepsis]QMS84420.1 hypothetical protein G4Z02_01235 [Xianfuyuplasma coldseepsis]
MFRRIYIYQEHIPDELIAVLSSLSDMIHVETVEDNVITLYDEDYYNEEPLDIDELYMLLVDDFKTPFTMILEPYSTTPFPLQEECKSFIKQLPQRILEFEDVIVYAVLYQNESFKQAVKDYIQSQINADVIHTVREFITNNMNSSVSAKKLYMHRNTLNYRIDNFIDATHINVKTFKGANAIYMLYQF